MALDTSVLMVLVPLLPVLVWLFLKFHESTYKVWERRGIVAKPGSFPFGSSRGYTREVEFQAAYQQQMYNEFKGEPYFGFYNGSFPFLMVRDPEYIKIVMAKEFSSFRDRQGLQLDPDDYMSHHLFNLEGEKWRALRVKMSPAFTSGKIKGLETLETGATSIPTPLQIPTCHTAIVTLDLLYSLCQTGPVVFTSSKFHPSVNTICFSCSSSLSMN